MKVTQSAIPPNQNRIPARRLKRSNTDGPDIFLPDLEAPEGADACAVFPCFPLEEARRGAAPLLRDDMADGQTSSGVLTRDLAQHLGVGREALQE